MMDNHRAALWCWLQELDLSKPHSTIHIDRHYDALASRLEEWLKHLPDWGGSIEKYLEKSYPTEAGEREVICWGNYLSIYLAEFRSALCRLILLTHDDGDKPDFAKSMECDMWDLPDSLSFWLEDGSEPWIVNIDLDYFCAGKTCVMVSDEYLRQVARQLRQSMEAERVGVVTLCLTPDSYTPGWEETERMATLLLAELGISFELPR